MVTRYRSTVRKLQAVTRLSQNRNTHNTIIHGNDGIQLNLLMIWAAGGHWVTGGVTGIAGSAVALQAALR